MFVTSTWHPPSGAMGTDSDTEDMEVHAAPPLCTHATQSASQVWQHKRELAENNTSFGAGPARGAHASFPKETNQSPLSVAKKTGMLHSPDHPDSMPYRAAWFEPITFELLTQGRCCLSGFYQP